MKLRLFEMPTYLTEDGSKKLKRLKKIRTLSPYMENGKIKTYPNVFSMRKADDKDIISSELWLLETKSGESLFFQTDSPERTCLVVSDNGKRIKRPLPDVTSNDIVLMHDGKKVSESRLKNIFRFPISMFSSFEFPSKHIMKTFSIVLNDFIIIDSKSLARI